MRPCAKNAFAAGTAPDSVGEHKAVPRPPSCIKGGLLLKRWDRKRGEGKEKRRRGKRMGKWEGNGME